MTTQTVAKVAGYARDPEHGCPTEGHGGECAGPLAGNGQLPCPTCCDATRSDGVNEYDVWNRVVAPDQASAERAASATAEVGQ